MIMSDVMTEAERKVIEWLNEVEKTKCKSLDEFSVRTLMATIIAQQDIILKLKAELVALNWDPHAPPHPKVPKKVKL